MSKAHAGWRERHALLLAEQKLSKFHEPESKLNAFSNMFLKCAYPLRCYTIGKKLSALIKDKCSGFFAKLKNRLPFFNKKAPALFRTGAFLIA
jgi:hypothetical protein